MVACHLVCASLPQKIAIVSLGVTSMTADVVRDFALFRSSSHLLGVRAKNYFKILFDAILTRLDYFFILNRNIAGKERKWYR